nr:retrovirus-related Pol polyprotein from transposon TNT 1-94 [Tanacetum cinerariifolium]
MAFLSSPGSTNKVDTANIQVSTVSTPVSTVSTHDNTANLSDATVYAFLPNQPNRSPKNQESRPKNQDSSRKIVNVEDTSSKTMVAINGAGFDWSYMADDEAPTNMALIAFSDSEKNNLSSTRRMRTSLGFASYNVVAPSPTGLFAPPTIDLFNSGLEEFQHPEFKGYGPKAILTNSRIVPISTARQSSSRAATPVSAARPINTVAPKPLVNVAKPRQNALQKSPSLSKRPFYQQTALKNKNLNNKIILLRYKIMPLKTADHTFVSDLTLLIQKEIYPISLTSRSMIDGMLHFGEELKVEKQHKISFKSKIQNSNSQPLFMLHMELFDPTSVNSIMHKKYCLVITDDFNGFTWVFFLATKNETIRILKKFITEIENQVDKKVKIIRCDNETEFKNSVMNEFCEEKDFKLPTTFWAEAVNTACYVQNRVIVVKPHFKTPYELFRGRSPALSFMRPFGCHVTILNTLDQLGKFDRKLNEGIFVGYPTISKAFRVYNTRTRKVEENLHITFLENKPMITGGRPEWLFDIDALTESMNYAPVPADDRDKGAEADYNNLETLISVSPIPSARVHKDHPKEQIIGEVYFVVQTRKMAKQNEADGTKEAQGHRQEEGIDYDEVFAPVARIEAISVKSATTSMETQKPLSNDADGTDVDVHLYRFQVQPKVSYMHAVKIIFRYLKGQPTLGLWYPKDLPLELIAYSDQDYAGASLDRKSTTEGCQFLGSRLIFWQCKKQTIMANSTTEVEYITASNCCGQTKHIEIRHHFIRDSNEKRLIEMVKIHTNYNVVDLLNKAFDVTSTKVSAARFRLELKGYLINDGYADLVNMLVTFLILLVFLMLVFTNITNGHQFTMSNRQERIGYSRENDNWKTRTRTRRMGIRILQSNVPINVADEAITKEIHDGLGRATTSSLEAKQRSGNIDKTQSKATPSGPSSPRTSTEGGLGYHFTMGDSHVQARSERVSNLPNEPPLREGNTSQSREGSMQLLELMDICTTLSNRVTTLENELSSTKAVYHKAFITLTKRVKKLETQLKQKRSRAVIHSSDEEEPSLEIEDSPKQGRMIEEIAKDENVNLVSEQREVHETAEPLQDDDDATLAETLLNIKRSTSKNKGKCIMQETELPKKIKKREMIQLSLDEELAQKLHAEELAKETARQEQEK